MESQKDDLINITVINAVGEQLKIGIPAGIGLNLMEVLKSSNLPVAATCGGMALCATCRVTILAGTDQLAPPGDAEQDMLDTLPYSDAAVRLSCQIPVLENLQGLRILLMPD
jgi:2Fe-2S ferredoxin